MKVRMNIYLTILNVSKERRCGYINMEKGNIKRKSYNKKKKHKTIIKESILLEQMALLKFKVLKAMAPHQCSLEESIGRGA